MVSFNLRIPKSDWVETILPQLKYKEVSLIELPKIEKPEFGDVATKINEAGNNTRWVNTIKWPDCPIEVIELRDVIGKLSLLSRLEIRMRGSRISQIPYQYFNFALGL